MRNLEYFNSYPVAEVGTVRVNQIKHIDYTRYSLGSLRGSVTATTTRTTTTAITTSAMMSEIKDDEENEANISGH